MKKDDFVWERPTDEEFDMWIKEGERRRKKRIQIAVGMIAAGIFAATLIYYYKKYLFRRDCKKAVSFVL